jgi:dTDP-4-dehydrorhamnose reductase
MQDRTILILGSTGQLGTELTRLCLSREEYRVHPLPREAFDVRNATALKELLEKIRPWAVVNCTAYNQVEAADSDPEGAFGINTIAIAHIARLCRELNIYFVHFSSDYVFDGESRRPYLENDLVSPVNIYGLSKASGEQALRLLHPRHCIIRSTGLYGFRSHFRPNHNFVEKVLTQAEEKKDLKVRKDIICTPTFVEDLAIASYELLKKEALGTFHITNSGECSWYEFATTILKTSGKEYPIQSIEGALFANAVRRPLYSVLDCTKLTELGIQPLAHWKEALKKYFQQRPHELKSK